MCFVLFLHLNRNFLSSVLPGLPLTVCKQLDQQLWANQADRNKINTNVVLSILRMCSPYSSIEGIRPCPCVRCSSACRTTSGRHCRALLCSLWEPCVSPEVKASKVLGYLSNRIESIFLSIGWNFMPIQRFCVHFRDLETVENSPFQSTAEKDSLPLHQLVVGKDDLESFPQMLDLRWT